MSGNAARVIEATGGFSQKRPHPRVFSKDTFVRVAAARNGKFEDLDVLVHDADPVVRRDVARQGRDEDLDLLVSDRNWRVRRAVAAMQRPADLDVLRDDSHRAVRAAAAPSDRRGPLREAAEFITLPFTLLLAAANSE